MDFRAPYSVFKFDRMTLRFFLLGCLLALELAGYVEPFLHNRSALNDVGAELAAQSVHRFIQLYMLRRKDDKVQV